VMQDNQADAFVEQRKKPSLLFLGDRSADVVQRDNVVTEQVIALENGIIGGFVGSERNGELGIIGEYFEEGNFVEVMTAGDQEHFDFGTGLGWRSRR